MITSFRNPRIAEVRRLRRRRERRAFGRTTIDGPFLLQEAMQTGIVIHEIFALPTDAETEIAAADAGVAVVEVSADVLQRLASSLNPRGPVAVVEIPREEGVLHDDAVVLWEISDPGNAGTIIRSAAAFGFQVIATRGTVDLWHPKVLRAGVGGHFRTALTTEISGLDDLERVGLAPVALAANGVDIGSFDMSGKAPVAFIVGNEAHGLPPAVSGRATTLSLPMPGGTESLNAGVAASIGMYLRMAHRR